MQIHQVQRNHKNIEHVQIGRGGARGKYSGRGIKGQKARSGHRMRPEMRDIVKKIPKRRGYGKNRAQSVNSSVVKAAVVNVGVLGEAFEAGAIVTPAALLAKKLVRRASGKVPSVKILGGGELAKKLSIKGCVVSGSALGKIEKAGGTIVTYHA